MRLRRHAKGDGPWEEEQHYHLPDASGGSSFRRDAQSVKSTTQVRVLTCMSYTVSYMHSVKQRPF